MVLHAQEIGWTTPLSRRQRGPIGSKSVVLKKGDQDKSDLWLEVWDETGLIRTRNIKTVASKVYCDETFGGVQWNLRGDRICFIGEIPNPPKYENYFDSFSRQQDAKEAPNSQEEKAWNSQKFEFTDEFGEKLEGKKRPAIFVYDLVSNEVQRVALDLQDVYPGSPCFDATGDGILFQGVYLSGKKMGLFFCHNRPISLFHINDVCYVPPNGSGKVSVSKCLTKSLFNSFQPVFSKDYSKLVFFGAQESYVQHTYTYELYCIDFTAPHWKPRKIISRFKEYPSESDSFAGLYCSSVADPAPNFLDSKGKYFAFQSYIKGKKRIYVVDTDTMRVDWIGLRDQSGGTYELLLVKEEVLVFQFTTYTTPPRVYLARFPFERDDPISHFSIQLLDQVCFVDKDLREKISSIKHETISLGNGAEGYLLYKPSTTKLPLVVVIHGGPFFCSLKDIFSSFQNLLLLQGIALLITNYTGSVSYGSNFMDRLVGRIGQLDVEDCANLCKNTLDRYANLLDKDRVGVTGGSHGGFLTAWLIGHPEYRKMFTVACMRNPVLHIPYAVHSTDIPDWMYACVLGRSLDSLIYTEEEETRFFKASPFSVIGNVSCPVLMFVGSKDFRVPPHQSIYYYNVLKKKVPIKLFMYPESGHLLSECEVSIECLLNVGAWFNRYL